MEGYELFETPIGHGSFSTVYKAKSRLTNEIVAVKIAKIENESLELQKPGILCYNSARIEREISMWKPLAHEHLCGLIDTFIIEKPEFMAVFVMEYAEKGDLLGLLECPLSELSVETILEYFGQLCESVAYLHSLDIIHGDIKLENVLLTENNCVKLSDFGLSRYASSESFDNCGSIEYAAPELIMGNVVDPFKTDIWSLGVVLYSLLYRKFPFDAQTLKLLRTRILFHEPSFDVSDEFSDNLIPLLRSLLDKNPERRPTASEITIKLNLFYRAG